jgi:glycosyltransferase involved in cell wall biosynthesis
MNRVFFVCSGLGHVHRGYETFMRDCYHALKDEPGLDLWLFKGAGKGDKREIPLLHLPRASFGARFIGEATNRGAYTVEQVSLTASLLPYIARERPDLIYYCDISIGKLLYYWRKVSGARYRLLLHNGGPYPVPYPWADHVHQLTPAEANRAVAAGVSPERQTLLPCGFHFGQVPRPASAEEQRGRRRELGLPLDRPIVLSVGALNRGHKRMDYLISEIASMGKDRPFLVMLGEVESETPAVRAIADLLLGPDGYLMRTVQRDAMDKYYRAADVFVLASLVEAFGLVYVEAMSHGLPCVAHDYPVSRFVFGDDGLLADLRLPGQLADQVRLALTLTDTPEHRIQRHTAVSHRFDWSALVPRYVAMMQLVAQPPAAPAPLRVGPELRIEAGREEHAATP